MNTETLQGVPRRDNDGISVVLQPADARYLFASSNIGEDLAEVHEILREPTHEGAIHTKPVEVLLLPDHIGAIRRAYRLSMIRARSTPNRVSQIDARLNRLESSFKKAARPSVFDRVKSTVSKLHR